MWNGHTVLRGACARSRASARGGRTILMPQVRPTTHRNKLRRVERTQWDKALRGWETAPRRTRPHAGHTSQGAPVGHSPSWDKDPCWTPPRAPWDMGHGPSCDTAPRATQPLVGHGLSQDKAGRGKPTPSGCDPHEMRPSWDAALMGRGPCRNVALMGRGSPCDATFMGRGRPRPSWATARHRTNPLGRRPLIGRPLMGRAPAGRRPLARPVLTYEKQGFQDGCRDPFSLSGGVRFGEFERMFTAPEGTRFVQKPFGQA